MISKELRPIFSPFYATCRQCYNISKQQRYGTYSKCKMTSSVNHESSLIHLQKIKRSSVNSFTLVDSFTAKWTVWLGYLSVIIKECPPKLLQTVELPIYSSLPEPTLYHGSAFTPCLSLSGSSYVGIDGWKHFHVDDLCSWVKKLDGWHKFACLTNGRRFVEGQSTIPNVNASPEYTFSHGRLWFQSKIGKIERIRESAPTQE